MNFAFTLACISSLVAGAIALVPLFDAKRSIARWSFAIGMVVLAIESFCAGLAADAVLPDDVCFFERLSLLAASCLPGIWLVFSLTFGRGNYRELLSKWRFGLWAALLAPAALGALFWRELLTVVNLSEGHWLLRLEPAGLALNLCILLASVLILMNLEATLRATVGTMRWRIKFMILGLGVLLTVRTYTGTQMLLFPAISLARNDFNSGALLISCILILRSILRPGHFDLDVYPSQSVLHNSVTLVVAGAYLIIVGVLARVVALRGGDASFELKALLVLVALVLLAVALLSDRVRLYTKRFLSQHFQRPAHAYRTVWRIFTKATARRVEQTDLCSAVVRLVSDVFEALTVAIWLVNETRDHLALGASTSLSQAHAGQLALSSQEAEEIISAMTSHGDPVDIDSIEQPWATALRRAHPDEFRKGGNRVCIPMIAADQLQGILMLGDRVRGLPFSFQDLELLKSVSDQTAASLLNIQLLQSLSQAKQLEAFQAMSAFFVHDLKNTASTLSLMLQNLPVHYHDAKFREDALRGISRTVSHLNDLIARLTALRQELAVQAVECDLNELINDTLKGQEQTPGVEVIKDLRQLPKLRFDPAQIQKVLTNLVVNARESLAGTGKILIETGQRSGWAVMAVSDTGCGMTSDFIRNSLFRPFQTTKKRGIGIGMFHCKMIIEAHHGKIEVESKPGKGTAFRVLLPLASR